MVSTPPGPFGDPRVMAVLAAVVGFSHLLARIRQDATLVRVVGTLLGSPYTSRQAAERPVACRLPGHHRYQLTPRGRRIAVLFTKVYGQVLAPGLAELNPCLPTDLVPTQRAGPGVELDRRLNGHRSTHRGLKVKLGLTVNSALTKRS